MCVCGLNGVLVLLVQVRIPAAPIVTSTSGLQESALFCMRAEGHFQNKITMS